MNGVEILESLRSLGVTVRLVAPDKLRLEPASRIPAEMLPRLREAKPALLDALRKVPSTCAASCYEAEPRRSIHHPWNGCTTVKLEANESRRKVAVICWHCNGEKRCDCSACWQAGPGDCVTCKGKGHVLR